MKYLFFVHSHISYLSALSIIADKQLNHNDCYVLSGSYKSEKPIKVININMAGRSSNRIGRLLDWLNPQRIADNTVDRLIGDAPFELYMAWAYTTCKFLMTHKNCRSYHFMEEGLSVYWNNMSLKEILFQRSPNLHTRSSMSLSGIKERLNDAYMVFRGYNSTIQFIPDLYFQFISDQKVHYYGFCDKSFHLAFRNKHVMNMVETLNNYEFENVLILDSKDIYVSDYNNLSHVSYNDYLKELDKLSLWLTVNHKKEIYIKWHYKCSSELKDKLTNYIKSKYNGDIHIIPTEVILEITFIKSNNLTVYGNTSSLLFYASLLGHKALSLNDSKNDCFTEYWNRVDLINVDADSIK